MNIGEYDFFLNSPTIKELATCYCLCVLIRPILALNCLFERSEEEKKGKRKVERVPQSQAAAQTTRNR